MYAELTLSRKPLNNLLLTSNLANQAGFVRAPTTATANATATSDDPVVYAQIDHSRKTKRKGDRMIMLPDHINRMAMDMSVPIRETSLT